MTSSTVTNCKKTSNKKDDDDDTDNNNNNNSSSRKKLVRPSTFKVWLTASRPHTLTASLCPCLVSWIANYNDPNFIMFHMILWTIFCITVQLGTNLHNDYSDYIRGADTVETRIGHTRATAAGWLTPEQTCLAATICVSITFSTGVLLIVSTGQVLNVLVWFIIISSVFNAFAYTAGPYPLGYIGLQNCSIAYYGLGDVFVFLYFGLVATYMIPYLQYCRKQQKQQQQQQQQVSVTDDWNIPYNWSSQFIYGIQIGLLAMNILVVNNLRDRLTDVIANKRTTSVRFGRTFSILQYITCNIITYSLVLVNAVLYQQQQQQQKQGQHISLLSMRLLPLLSIPIAIKETLSILQKEGSALNIHVGGAAKVQTLFCILTSLGIFLTIP